MTLIILLILLIILKILYNNKNITYKQNLLVVIQNFFKF